jgi:protein gp37
MALARRLKAMGSPRYQTDGNPITSGPGFGVQWHPDALEIPKRWKRPRTVFVNSMSDLFHAKIPLEFVWEVFAVIEETPQHTYQVLTKRARRLRLLSDKLSWPRNLWMGVSVESTENLGRIDDLREVPAAVRFLSCEPLLGELKDINLDGIDWVIAGGESGPNARSLDERWVTSLKEVCEDQEVHFFFKQWGGRTPKSGGRLLQGKTWDGLPKQARSA